MMGIALAATYNPRGEMGRLQRLHGQLLDVYSCVAISLPPWTTEQEQATLVALPGVQTLVNSEWSHGRYMALKMGLATEADHIHYADMDRLLRWVETRQEEWRQTVGGIQQTDFLIIGRTEQAYQTHPQALVQTERISNAVVSHFLGRAMDVSAGSKGFSRSSVEFLLANTVPGRALGADGEWTVLLHRAGFRVDYVEVDGLDWETADRYQEQAANDDEQRRLAEQYDKNAENWAMRVRVALEIAEAGLDAMQRALTEEKIMTTIQTIQGVDAIAAMFAQAKAQKRAAFLPYFPIGYPTYDESVNAIAGMAEVGVDGFEIGIPFSDPLADGPTIQAATQIALENGTTVRDCLKAVRELRARGVTQPILLMGYVNPMLAYGVEAFVQDAKAAGADGLIIPDLPPEEGSMFCEVCSNEGLALVFFLAPTSNAERMTLVTQRATGFIYVVSLTGVTGERKELPPDLKVFIERVRTQADKPLVIGFGIGTPEQARMMNGLVEGFIVGSALVRAGKEGAGAVRTLAASLRAALD
jgi:tryptophan synthase alpha chain